MTNEVYIVIIVGLLVLLLVTLIGFIDIVESIKKIEKKKYSKRRCKIKSSSVIEETLDEIVIIWDLEKYRSENFCNYVGENGKPVIDILTPKYYFIERERYDRFAKEVYGAIWTDEGLIYVAKMNDKGEFELI